METTELKPPKVVPKLPKRNDYVITVELLKPLRMPHTDVHVIFRRVDLITIEREDLTQLEAAAVITSMEEGFSKCIVPGTLTQIMKYNIAAIHATKKEKSENIQLQSQGTQAPADGAGQTA